VSGWAHQRPGPGRCAAGWPWLAGIILNTGACLVLAQARDAATGRSVLAQCQTTCLPKYRANNYA
jgi:hypothetical protein